METCLVWCLEEAHVLRFDEPWRSMGLHRTLLRTLSLVASMVARKHTKRVANVERELLNPGRAEIRGAGDE